MGNKKTMEEAAEILKQQLAKDKPYILQLEKVVAEVDSGVCDVSLRIYKGRVTDLLVIKSKRFVFPENK